MNKLFFLFPLLFFAAACGGIAPTMNSGSGLEFRPSNTTCLAPSELPPNNNIPTLLSETGCFSANDPTQAAEGLIPYDLNVPFWSDGEIKQRWMAVPDNSTVLIGDDGKFIFPTGTILVKNFSVNGQLIETRLLMQHQAGQWAGYAYEWNEEVSEASLVAMVGKTRTLSNGQEWFYPGQLQCLNCHTQAAGRVLGGEVAQFNRLFNYPQTGIAANQLTTLAHIGLLELDSNIDVTTLEKFPDLNQGFPPPDQLEAAARAYLHVNCSICHQPQGPGGGPEDFRALIPFSEMNACNVAPTRGDLGVADAKLLFPAEPDKSILLLRMKALDTNRMPPLASSIVDFFGVDLMTAWIESITACP